MIEEMKVVMMPLWNVVECLEKGGWNGVQVPIEAAISFVDNIVACSSIHHDSASNESLCPALKYEVLIGCHVSVLIPNTRFANYCFPVEGAVSSRPSFPEVV